MATNANTADIEFDNQHGQLSEEVTFSISINSAPNDVAAFGFDVQYDLSILRYRGYSADYLVRDYDFLNANNASPGIVRVGGFVAGEGKIIQGESGSMMSLTFEIVGHDDCQLSLAQLKDDFKDWKTNPGHFTGDHNIEQEDEIDSSPTTDDANNDLISSQAQITENHETGQNNEMILPSSTSEANDSTISSQPQTAQLNVNNITHASSQPQVANTHFNHLPKESTIMTDGNIITQHIGNKRIYDSGFQAESKTKQIISPSKNIAEKNMIPNKHNKRVYEDRSHPENKMKWTMANSIIRDVKSKTPRAMTKTPAHNNFEEQARVKMHTTDIPINQAIDISGLRAIMGIILLFGAICNIAIGLSVLFVGCILWEAIRNVIQRSIVRKSNLLHRKQIV